jgi:hypothetical protein
VAEEGSQNQYTDTPSHYATFPTYPHPPHQQIGGVLMEGGRKPTPIYQDYSRMTPIYQDYSRMTIPQFLDHSLHHYCNTIMVVFVQYNCRVGTVTILLQSYYNPPTVLLQYWNSTAIVHYPNFGGLVWYEWKEAKANVYILSRHRRTHTLTDTDKNTVSN